MRGFAVLRFVFDSTVPRSFTMAKKAKKKGKKKASKKASKR